MATANINAFENPWGKDIRFLNVFRCFNLEKPVFEKLYKSKFVVKINTQKTRESFKIKNWNFKDRKILRPDSESASKVYPELTLLPPIKGLGYLIARDGRIGVKYLKKLNINSLLVLKFY